MGVELGGRASKLGDTYERLWAVRHALLVVEGRYRSLLWEPIGEDEIGVDLWVTALDGHRIGHQLKRQNRGKEYWTVADLRSEGVLTAAKLQLERDVRTEFVFVSSCGARHLRDLTERSRRDRGDPRLFLAEHVDSEKERKKAFAELLSTWGLSRDVTADVAVTFGLLQRMTFEVNERTERVRREVEHVAALQIEGEPATIVASIGDLLDNNLGREFHADDLRQHLLGRGFRLRQLVGDATIPPAIERLQDRFDRAIAPRLIAGMSLARPEAGEIVQRILGDRPPRIVFVHGGMGVGKSVVLHQVFTELRDRGTPVLPLQLHTSRPEGTPHAFGRTKCGLPGSPAAALRALAGTRQAVVLLDQLDALRLTSSHSHEPWAAFIELVDDILADHAMTVVTACRSFDLENDPNIAAWRRDAEREQDEATEIRVGDLPDEQVTGIVRPFGVVFSDLPARQQSLLKQPNNLALWRLLAECNQLPDSVNNATQLMGRFIDVRRSEAVREHSAQVADVDHVLSILVRYLDAEGRLDAPAALVGSYTPVVDALCSAGLLNRDDGTVTFAHQSYFDHLIAERVLAEALQDGRELGQWVRANQSLFRRDQLRQLLTLLRECDHVRHADLLRAILVGDDIRFHLKHLVLGLLRQADPVLDHETEIVVDLSRDSGWWEHISGVIWARVPWFEALDRRTTLADWLTNSGDDRRIRQVLRFFRSVTETHGERIDEILLPYWDAGVEWGDRLLEVLSFNPCGDSPRMAELRLNKIRSREIVFTDMFMDDLAKCSPGRLVELLGAAISVWVQRIREHMRASASTDTPEWPFHDQRLNSEVLNAIRGKAQLGWDTFTDSLSTITRLQRVNDRGLRTLRDLHNVNWSTRHLLSDAHQFVENLVTASIEGMAQACSDDVARVLDALSPRLLRGLERSITKGLAAGNPLLANRAIQWLCDEPSRFHLGDGHDEIYWDPARALIEHFAPHCSRPMFEQLESTILGYHDAWERESVKLQLKELKKDCLLRNDWGRAQNVLLGALPEDRMSPRAKSAAATWRGKFGNPANERPIGTRAGGGRVTSPIPPDRLQFVSDREWLRIVRGEWPEHAGQRWRQHAPNVVGEASVRHFADALGVAAGNNPRRFATLALRIPADSSLAYFVAILRELIPMNAPRANEERQPASVADLEAIMDHVGNREAQDYVQTVCWAIQEREDGQWSDRAVERVISYAEHPHPEPGEYTVHRQSGENDAMTSDVAGTAINCARGAVAGAIGALLWKRPDAYDQLLPAVQRLLTDPHPSVRFESMCACLPIWNRDKDRAVRLIVSACDHRDARVLGSRWLNRLISCARTTHLDQLTPIIERMARSREDSDAESGATWATACWLDGGQLADLVQICRTGSRAQRCGVAEAALQYFAGGNALDKCRPILVAMFDDSERDVRSRAANVFRHEDVFSVAGCVGVTRDFIQSAAFHDDPGDLLHPLSEYRSDLTRFSDSILAAADVLAGSFADETRDMRQRNSFAGNELSTLLFRLYDHAYGARNQELQDHCLDRWDAMLKNRVGMTESYLRILDD